MHGIITKTMSKKNLSRLAEKAHSEPLTLLIGFASVARTKVTLKALPKKNRGDMLQSLLNNSYDSMLYPENGFTNLIVWDPFPLTAVYRLKVTNEQLLHLAGNVGDKFGEPSLEPLSVSYKAPPKGFLTGYSVFNSEDDDDDADSSAGLHLRDQQDEKVRGALHGTVLEDLRVDVDWPGGINSDGILQPNVEQDLMDKLQFVNRDSPPLKAIQLLKKLLSKANAEKSSLLQLLLAAETTNHDPERAKEYLQKFVQSARQFKSNKRIHPWSIIVAARVEPAHADRLLSIFVHLFPLQQGLLQESELHSLRGDENEKSDGTPGWSELLEDEWRALQERYPKETKSEAMEELLALTGLRKVKEEALRLWNSALQLQRMDPIARKLNVQPTNYIFAGNPGSGKIIWWVHSCLSHG